jgi:hypothetical protein
LVQADIAASGVEAGPVVFPDLSADEQAATTVSEGRGRAEFSLDRVGARLSWRVTTTALDSTVLGVAIHGPQRIGTNAGVQVDLAPQGARAVLTGSAVLTEAQLDYLLAGRMYVNVRTRRYAGRRVARSNSAPAAHRCANWNYRRRGACRRTRRWCRADCATPQSGATRRDAVAIVEP